MRTDVVVRTSGEVRAPQIPIAGSAGRRCWVRRGDWIEWDIDRYTHRGRIVGFVDNPDDGELYIVVVWASLQGCCSERWVKPADVVNAVEHGDIFQDKINWLHGPDFRITHPDKARNCYHLTADELL